MDQDAVQADVRTALVPELDEDEVVDRALACLVCILLYLVEADASVVLVEVARKVLVVELVQGDVAVDVQGLARCSDVVEQGLQ